MIKHKVDTGSDGSKMPIHVFSVLSPKLTKQQHTTKH